MPELSALTAQQIQAELAHARATSVNLQALCKELKALPRQAAMARYLHAVNLWQRGVNFQLADIDNFSRVHLGTLTAAEVSGLEGPHV